MASAAFSRATLYVPSCWICLITPSASNTSTRGSSVSFLKVCTAIVLTFAIGVGLIGPAW
jgi:hypothetical protein